MPRQRALVLAATAAIILSGCSNASAPRTPPRPRRPITAEFLGSVGVPSVTATQFVDPLHGWIGVAGTPYFQGQAVPSPGTLLRTTDGGRSWQVVAHTQLPILAIDFSSPQDGFVLAGAWIDATTEFTVYRSADGGGTLQELSHPQADAGKAVMHFSSPMQGFIVSQNTLDVTTDGGHTWQTSSAQPKPGFFGGPMPFAPAFLSAGVGFTASGNGVMRTTDGGHIWQSVYALPDGDGGYGPVTFATPSVGYAGLWVNAPALAQSSSIILRTDDGGTSWRIVSGALPGGTVIGTPPPSGAADGLVAWGQEDVAVAEQGALYVSRDGGVTWTSIAAPQLSDSMWGNGLTYDPGVGLFADDMYGTLMRLTANDTWQPVWPTAPLARVDFANASQGFGLAREQGQLRLVRTADGGRSWSAVPLPGGSAPTDLTFAGTRHGWVVRGAGARPLATANGGKTWRPIGPKHVLAAQLFPGGSGLLIAQMDVAKPPILLATSDGGEYFVRRSLPKELPVGGIVRFASPQVGFAAAADEIWRTDDGGQHWRFISMPAQLAGFERIVSLGADPSGDLWLLAAFDRSGGPVTPQDLWIRHLDGAWQEVRLPGVDLPFDTTGESLDVYSRSRAWLVTPAGVFATTDGGRTWRPDVPGL